MFKACLENGVRTVIYASSVSVYPFDEQLGSHAQFREEDSERKVNPEGGYGWAKYIAEKQLALMPGVSYGVARIFHAYGKNIYLKPDRSQVIASLIRKAVRYPAEDFVVWGDGSQRRCFVYIDDALDALMRLEKHVVERGNLTVNVGSTEETTVRDLAERIVRLSKKDIPLKFDDIKAHGGAEQDAEPGESQARARLEPYHVLLRGAGGDLRLGKGQVAEAGRKTLRRIPHREPLGSGAWRRPPGNRFDAQTAGPRATVQG